MTSKEYEQRLEALEREIAALKLEGVEDEPTPKPPHPRWRPAYGEEYYLISRDRSIMHFNWDGGSIDTDLFAAANVYKSIDAAKFDVERLKVLADMREWAGDWTDKWRIIYAEDCIEISPVLQSKIGTYGELRFATEEDAENCIRAVGEDRIKKYYFRVSEEDT